MESVYVVYGVVYLITISTMHHSELRTNPLSGYVRTNTLTHLHTNLRIHIL